MGKRGKCNENNIIIGRGLGICTGTRDALAEAVFSSLFPIN